MGEAKRRKLLDPGYGKNSLYTEEEQEFILKAQFFLVLIGIESWRKSNLMADWRRFFAEKTTDLMCSDKFPSVCIKTDDDYAKFAFSCLQTVLVFNPPLPFTSSQSFNEFLVEKVTNLNPKDMADLMNRTREERAFLLDCVMVIKETRVGLIS